MKKKISEGLRKNDLKGILSNIVSIDEYSGKVSKDSVVIAFFSIDKDLCKDIKDYLLKSPNLEILDIDYEEKTNKDNFYTIYVDLPKNKEFINNFLELMKEMNRISDIKNWYMKIYNKKLLHRLTDKNIERFLRELI